MLGLLLIVGASGVGIEYLFRTSGPAPQKAIDDQHDVLVLPSQNRTTEPSPEPVSPASSPEVSVAFEDEQTTPAGTTPRASGEPIDVADEVAAQSSTTSKDPISVTTELTQVVEQEQPADELTWSIHPIKSGESLSAIFKQNNLSPGLLHNIVNSSETAAKLAKIRPGQSVHFGMDEEQQLQKLILERNRISSLHITLADGEITSEEQTRELEKVSKSATGVINSSLFVDGQDAGLSDRLIMQLAKVFGWDIDFALDVMPGDSFSLIYQEQYLDGEKFSDGPILAAEFVNQGKVFRAVQYTDSEGNTNYYDDTGHAKQRAFLRTPVKFARISSKFTRKRWHPVLKRWRSHKGVDYAAPTGTPIKAAGTGKVVFKGKKGGYGNVIFLRHGGRYTTVYGHMSKFAKGIKKGGKVKQGQTIGYVGQTGLASGPHLHYEFRVNGVHRNPLTVKLPKAEALPKKQMAEFTRQTAPLLANLEKEKAASMLAMAK